MGKTCPRLLISRFERAYDVHGVQLRCYDTMPYVCLSDIGVLSPSLDFASVSAITRQSAIHDPRFLRFVHRLFPSFLYRRQQGGRRLTDVNLPFFSLSGHQQSAFLMGSGPRWGGLSFTPKW